MATKHDMADIRPVPSYNSCPNTSTSITSYNTSNKISLSVYSNYVFDGTNHTVQLSKYMSVQINCRVVAADMEMLEHLFQRTATTYYKYGDYMNLVDIPHTNGMFCSNSMLPNEMYGLRNAFDGKTESPIRLTLNKYLNYSQLHFGQAPPFAMLRAVTSIGEKKICSKQ